MFGIGRKRTATWLGAVVVVLAATGCGKNKFQQELEQEALAVKVAKEIRTGDYDPIDTQQMKQLIDEDTDMILIDAMPYEESFKKSHLPGAKNFVFDKVVMDSWDDSKTGGTTTDYQGLLGPDKTRLIVVYCGFSTCARSHNAARFARELGYSNVSRYVGGIYAWKGAGHTTEVAEEHRNLASVSCSHHPH